MGHRADGSYDRRLLRFTAPALLIVDDLGLRPVEPGEQLPQATINRFLRDHYTNAPGDMDPTLPEILMRAANHFKSDRVTIVSGLRHPKYNLLLRKKGHQVARDSHHTKGNAIDFNLPKVTTEALRTCKAASSTWTPAP